MIHSITIDKEMWLEAERLTISDAGHHVFHTIDAVLQRALYLGMNELSVAPLGRCYHCGGAITKVNPAVEIDGRGRKLCFLCNTKAQQCVTCASTQRLLSKAKNRIKTLGMTGKQATAKAVELHRQENSEELYRAAIPRPGKITRVADLRSGTVYAHRKILSIETKDGLQVPSPTSETDIVTWAYAWQQSKEAGRVQAKTFRTWVARRQKECWGDGPIR